MTNLTEIARKPMVNIGTMITLILAIAAGTWHVAGIAAEQIQLASKIESQAAMQLQMHQTLKETLKVLNADIQAEQLATRKLLNQLLLQTR